MAAAKKRKPKGYDMGGTVLSSNSLGNAIMGGANMALRGYGAYEEAKRLQQAQGAPDGSKPMGAAKGGKIKRTAGPPIGKDDGLIPAQKGEYVVRKSAVNKLGTKALNTINKGKLPKGNTRGR